MWTGGCATMTVSAVRDPAGTLAFACIVHSSLLSPSPSPGSYLEAGYKCYHLQKWARISHSFLGAKLGSELQFTQSTRDTELLWTEAVDGGGGRRLWTEAEDRGRSRAVLWLCVREWWWPLPPGGALQGGWCKPGGSRCRVHASAPRSELAQWQPYLLK